MSEYSNLDAGIPRRVSGHCDASARAGAEGLPRSSRPRHDGFVGVSGVWDSIGSVIRSDRIRRGLALGAVALAMVFTLPRFLTHTPYPRLGVRMDWTSPSGNPRVTSVIGPPGQGLLQKDDVMLSAEGVPFTQKDLSQVNPKTGYRGLPMGPFDLAIQRGGRTKVVTVPPLAMTPWQRVRLWAFPLITVVAAPLVAILLVWRRTDLAAAWVFLLFAVLEAMGTIFSLYRFPQGELRGPLQTYVTLYHAVVLWLPASFLHFMMMFPRPRWQGRRPTRSVSFWLVVAAYLTPIALLIASRVTHTEVDKLEIWFQAVAIPLGSLSLIQRYALGRSGGVSLRERVLAVTAAVILCLASAVDLLPDDPRMMAWFSLPLMQLFSTALFFAWLSTPFLIAYLVANDPAFDPRRLIARSLPYAILSGLLAAVYLGLVLVAQRLFAQTTGEETLAFNVVAALVVAFAFAPLRERFQTVLNRIFGRDPMALRLALEQSGRELLSALDAGEVRSSVEAGIARGLRRPVAIDWSGPGMPRLAEDVSPSERGPVEALLIQAGIRLENLSLHKQRAVSERRAAELREAATRAELRALHAQVQPHFLFNALNALSYLAESDPPAAQRFTERLADMLRYSVQAGERPAALLHEEIAFIEDYLGVARERYDNPLTFEYRGVQELLSSSVPPLLLQPLVENSLKHGCAADGRPLRLALEAACEAGWLSLRFVDDGAPNGRAERGLGVGLDNLLQRVRHFGGPGATVETARLDRGGFAVTMRWRPARGPEGDGT